MRIFENLDDFGQSVGEEIGVSEWRTITQEDINAFAEVTDDQQWIHVDPERAATGPFGSTVAHGYLTLSLISGFLFSSYRLDGVAMAVNYGSNKVRYPAPVYSGGKVRGRIKLLELDRQEGWAQSVIQVTIEQEAEGSKPACVAEIVSRLYEAPEPSSDN